MPDTQGVQPIPVAVLGGTGYVAGELCRLLALHPQFQLAAIASSSRAGRPLVEVFPHLHGTRSARLSFSTEPEVAEAIAAGWIAGLFAATPHGATAGLIDKMLAAAEAGGTALRVVDLSADFRFPDAARFEAIYRQPHGAPDRLAAFHCGLPEHQPALTPRHAAHPGCFTTAVVGPLVPLLAAGLIESDCFVSAVTGSSGAGRKPTDTTHHPARNATLYAYSPLGHRHEAEMRQLLAAATGGREPEIEFVPHSGPFVRGIHATLRCRLTGTAAAAEARAAIAAFYGAESFFDVSTALPRLTEVVGTNRCRIGAVSRGRTLVLTAVLDNLIKGAAGGAIQWMNRLFGFDNAAGLQSAGFGWY